METKKYNEDFSKDFKSFFWEEDKNIQTFCQNPNFRQILERLKRRSTRRSTHHAIIDNLWSSYRQYGYQLFFSEMVTYFKPKLVVEIGVLQGFSLLSMGVELKKINAGEVHGYDLFEEYQYRNEKMETVQKNISALELDKFVKIYKKDAFVVADQYSDIDILHVDISNNGEVVDKMFRDWNKKVQHAIIFEGGSEERDQIEWMKKFNKKPIHPEIEKIKKDFSQWDIFVLNQFPSITCCFKK